MFRNLVFAALAVGILSGLVLALVQQVAVTPTILAAEAFEISEAAPEAHGHGHAAHSHDAEAWAPEDGAERIFYTTVANILSAIGFALLILSAMAYSGKGNLKNGVLWGLAGYISFFVAPAMGLHPEIPGMEAANLQGRQGWWLITVLSTAAGLALIAFGQASLKVGGIVLLMIPHVLGAPLPETHGFAHPDAQAVAALEKLAHSFLQSTAIANGVFWLVLGVSSGYLVNKFGIIKATQA
ncbi:MAG: CbtA family protein [Bermanella sp.]